MIDDVCQLLGEQTNVKSVQYASGTWRGEVQLEVACSVPRECRNATVAGDTELIKHRAYLTRPFGPLGVGRTFDTSARCGDDCLMPEISLGAIKEMQDTQRYFLHQSWNLRNFCRHNFPLV